MAYGRDILAPEEKIRVLVVDDSALIRRMVSRIFERDPAIELIGTACDGLDALAKIEQLKPHVVTLDVEMPELDGLGALRRITQHHPSVRVVMFSSLTEQGSKVTIDALMSGASDYVTKPANDRPWHRSSRRRTGLQGQTVLPSLQHSNPHTAAASLRWHACPASGDLRHRCLDWRPWRTPRSSPHVSS